MLNNLFSIITFNDYYCFISFTLSMTTQNVYSNYAYSYYFVISIIFCSNLYKYFKKKKQNN